MVQGQEVGRVAQRRRTRKAIVDAATRLLGAGSAPTVDQVAIEADVSRRTVYMHFPTFDQLLLDASLGALSAIEQAPASEGDPDDAVARVDTLARSVLERAPETLPLGRQIIRLTVDPAGGPESSRRGFRRVQWIETAVEPLRAELSDEQFERLVSALAVVIGFESMVVMHDVRGADAETEMQVIRWAATALVKAMRAESDHP